MPPSSLRACLSIISLLFDFCVGSEDSMEHQRHHHKRLILQPLPPLQSVVVSLAMNCIFLILLYIRLVCFETVFPSRNQRFRKGKDLSAYSAIDIAAIFGRSSSPSASSTASISLSSSSASIAPSSPSIDLVTHTSGQSIRNYFQNKMALGGLFFPYRVEESLLHVSLFLC